MRFCTVFFCSALQNNYGKKQARTGIQHAIGIDNGSTPTSVPNLEIRTADTIVDPENRPSLDLVFTDCKLPRSRCAELKMIREVPRGLDSPMGVVKKQVDNVEAVPVDLEGFGEDLRYALRACLSSI